MQPFELTYWEALRAFWRIYWPAQIVSFLSFVALGILAEADALPLAVLQVLVPVALYFLMPLLTLYLFVPRLTSRPYRKFRLVLLDPKSNEETARLRGKARAQATFFLWWRQMVAALLMGGVSVPLNFVLALLGLQVTGALAILGGLLAIGPLLIKMLTGHPFATFRVEARRGAPGEAPDPPEVPA